jgi:hypothetical protein
MALTDNLVAYWSMREFSDGSGAVTRADSHGSNTLNDPVHVSSGTGLVYANALALVRADGDFMYIDDNAALSMGNIDFTVAAWVNLSSKPGSPNHMTMFCKGSFADESYGLLHEAIEDRWEFVIYGGAGQTNKSGVDANNFGAPSLNTWYFVVGWYDSTAHVTKICVNDGTVDTGNSQSLGAYDDAAEAEVGRTFGAATSNLDGLLGPIMIWKRLLTAPEITQLYNGGAGLTYAAMVSPSGFLLNL